MQKKLMISITVWYCVLVIYFKSHSMNSLVVYKGCSNWFPDFRCSEV